MTLYPVLVWVHILLFVYWLGADLGVLIAAIWVKDAKKSFAERALLLRLAVAIDLTPRLAFVLMMPVGVTLAQNWGLPVGPAGLAAIWALALIWLALVLTTARSHGSGIGEVLGRIQFWFLLIGGGVFLTLGAFLLKDGIVPAWLGWKIILYGCIFFLSIGIDLGFRPLMPAFARLAAEGSTDEIETAIRRPIDVTVTVVLALYLILLLISFLGVVKPDIG